MSIKSLLHEIASTSSRNEKKKILERERENTEFKLVCQRAYHPAITYYIKKIPQVTSHESTLSIAEAVFELDKLAHRVVTGHAALDHIADILTQCSPDDAYVICCIVERDLKCGIQESTINSVWKNLIPTFPNLLACADDPKARAKITFPAIVQEKMDGMRVNVMVTEDDVVYRSRNGKLVDCGRDAMDGDFIRLRNSIGMDYVFDGELLFVDRLTQQPLPRKISNGIANKAIKGTINDSEKLCARICIWDAIPLASFIDCKFNVPYTTRMDTYLKAIHDAVPFNIFPVQSWDVNSWDDAKKIYAMVIADGKEGLIVKNKRGIWEDKRSPDLVKMKEEKICEMVVVDWIEGEGKYSGCLGALSCQSGGAYPVQVNIGSGFTDAQRREFTRENIVGQIVSVQYNEIIKAEDGSRSLFLPVFIEVRHDKSVPDLM